MIKLRKSKKQRHKHSGVKKAHKMSNNPPKSFLDLYDEETANNSSNSSNSKKKPSKFKRDPMGFDIGVGGSNFLKDPLAGYLNGTSSGKAL